MANTYNSFEQYISENAALRQTLADTLAEKGIEASGKEGYASLVPKVASVTGGENLDAEITTQDDLITQLQTAIQGKAGASGGLKVMEESYTVVYDETKTFTLPKPAFAVGLGIFYDGYVDGGFFIKGDTPYVDFEVKSQGTTICFITVNSNTITILGSADDYVINVAAFYEE